MKLFETKELKQQLEQKENKIKYFKKELLQEINASEIKDNIIEDLEETINDKDKRILELWKDMNQLSLQNKQYFDTIKMAADENLKLKEEIKRLKGDVKAGPIIGPIEAKVTISSYENDLNKVVKEVKKHLTRVNGQKPYEEETFYNFDEFTQHDWQFLIAAIARDYKNCKNPNEVFYYWELKLKKQGYKLKRYLFDSLEQKSYRFDIVTKDLNILASFVRLY